MDFDPVLDSHPNAPRRGPVWLAFAAVVVAGGFGATIGYGLVSASCSNRPPVLQQLLAAAVPGYSAHASSCDGQIALATILGAVIAAVGVGIVAMLVLRAMSDWNAHRPEPKA